jgi:outer membrane protein
MNTYFRKLFLLLFFALGSLKIQAQEVLTLDQALEIGLKNNFSILIAKNQSEIAANGATYGKAGMLPQLNLNATQTNGIVNSHQVFASGQEQDRPSAKSSSMVAGASLNWTLFDGFAMFASYEKLKQLHNMGDLNAKKSIEDGVEDIINAYYQVVMQKQLLKVMLSTMDISSERKKIAEAKFNIGSDSKLSYLQATVDFNGDKSALLKQKIALENSKIALNAVLAREVNAKFEVVDTIVINYKPTLEELRKKLSQNTDVLQAEGNISISNLSIKEFRAKQYPRFGVFANYNYLHTESQAGFILLTQTVGPTYGFTASMNLFNGWNLNRDYKNAQLDYLNRKMQLNQVKNELDANVSKAFNTFNNQMELLKLEQENLKVAQENLNATMERYRIGSISAFDVKEAQRSYKESENRFLTSLYDAKVSETTLLRFSGGLIK